MKVKCPLAICETCPLRDEAFVAGSGPDKVDLVIVGEAPGSEEVLVGLPFAARYEGRMNAGYILWECLRQVDVERENVFVTNVCCCRPPGNRTPTPIEIKACTGRLFAEIRSREPKLILALGNTAFKTLATTRMGITEGRKHDWSFDGIPVVATYHPAAIIRQGDLFQDFANDLEEAIDKLNGKGDRKKPDQFSYAVIEKVPEFRGLVKLLANEEYLAVDIETSGFNPRADYILCVTVGWDSHSAVIDGELLTDLSGLKLMNDLLRGKKQIYHNAKFDVPHLQAAGVDTALCYDDTMLMSYALDERKGIHGLKELSKLYLGAADYESELKKYLPNRKTSYAEIPKEILYKYAAFDSFYTYSLAKVLRRKVEEQGLDRLYRTILVPASKALQRVESNGLLIDQDYLRTLGERLSGEMARLEHELQKLVGDPTYNPRSPMQTEDVLRRLCYVSPEHKGTSKAILEELSKYDFPRKLLEYRKAAKMHSTYIEGIQKVLEPDGRVYPSYLVHGTETGRLSSTRPAIHTIPRDPEVRNLFIAPEGWSLVYADHNQCVARDTFVSVSAGYALIQNHPQSVSKGVANTLIVRTKRGYSIQCTPDHRLLTADGWVEARRLPAGTFLALQGEDVITEEFSPYWWVVGFWVGDGSVGTSPGTITFARGIEEDEKNVRAWLAETLNEIPRDYNSQALHMTNQRAFKEHVCNLFDKKALALPLDQISNLRSFLQGLFDADGYADINGVGLSTKYFRLAIDVQQVLLRFGVMSTLVKTRGGQNYIPGGADTWNVMIRDPRSLTNFCARVGFRLPRKSDILTKTMSSRKRGYTNPVPIPIAHVRTLDRNNAFYRKYVLGYLHERPYQREKAEALQGAEEWIRYHWDTVADIFEGPRVEVFDILNQPENRFVASGIVVHNCEMRVMAMYSNDAKMVEIFTAGRKIHSEIARELYGENFNDEEYMKAKMVSFGILYGRGAHSLSLQFGTTIQEAQSYINRFFEMMPQVRKFLDGVHRQAVNESVLETAFGRKRRFGLVTPDNMHEVITQSNNFHCQSTASDITLLALIELCETLDPSYAKVISFIHDSLTLEVRDDKVSEVLPVLKETMESIPKRYLGTDVPFLAEPKVGKRWGDLH